MRTAQCNLPHSRDQIWKWSEDDLPGQFDFFIDNHTVVNGPEHVPVIEYK